jgi:hypothetical protein
VLCFSDNDVILKLAAFDLLSDFLPAVGVTMASVRVLPTAKYVLTPLAKQHGGAVAKRVAGFLGAAGVIDWELPADEVRLFEDTLGIDPGEAILFAATAKQRTFVLTTGDKVSLAALAGSPECEKITKRLAGRVVCLEQLVQRCIDHHGFEPVKRKIVPARECDKALRAIFGSGLTASENGVRDGLGSYVESLRSTTGSLLAAD